MRNRAIPHLEGLETRDVPSSTPGDFVVKMQTQEHASSMRQTLAEPAHAEAEHCEGQLHFEHEADSDHVMVEAENLPEGTQLILTNEDGEKIIVPLEGSGETHIHLPGHGERTTMMLQSSDGKEHLLGFIYKSEEQKGAATVTDETCEKKHEQEEEFELAEAEEHAIHLAHEKEHNHAHSHEDHAHVHEDHEVHALHLAHAHKHIAGEFTHEMASEPKHPGEEHNEENPHQEEHQNHQPQHHHGDADKEGDFVPLHPELFYAGAKPEVIHSIDDRVTNDTISNRTSATTSIMYTTREGLDETLVMAGFLATGGLKIEGSAPRSRKEKKRAVKPLNSAA